MGYFGLLGVAGRLKEAWSAIFACVYVWHETYLGPSPCFNPRSISRLPLLVLYKGRRRLFIPSYTSPLCLFFVSHRLMYLFIFDTFIIYILSYLLSCVSLFTKNIGKISLPLWIHSWSLMWFIWIQFDQVNTCLMEFHIW